MEKQNPWCIWCSRISRHHHSFVTTWMTETLCPARFVNARLFPMMFLITSRATAKGKRSQPTQRRSNTGMTCWVGRWFEVGLWQLITANVDQLRWELIYPDTNHLPSAGPSGSQTWQWKITHSYHISFSPWKQTILSGISSHIWWHMIKWESHTINIQQRND